MKRTQQVRAIVGGKEKEMSNRLKIKGHLNTEEIEDHYRKATDIVERTHWQIIRLVEQGKSTPEIAEITGYCINWVRTLIHRYNEGGPEAIEDKRHYNKGGSFILSQEQLMQLQEALEQPPEDGGLWTGPKVAQWMQQHVGHCIHPQRGWEYLKRLGYSKRVLRPRHAKADLAEQEAFKKNFHRR